MPSELEKHLGLGYAAHKTGEDPATGQRVWLGAGPDPEADCPARGNLDSEQYGDDVDIVEDSREHFDGVGEMRLMRCTGCGRTWWEA